MGKGIYGEPNEYDAGLDFNYDVWTPGTKVTFMNVPWDSAYRNIVRWGTALGRNTWFKNNRGSNRSIVIDRLHYARANQPVRLTIPYAEAMKYNYLIVENPRSPVNSEEREQFFYFILGVEHVAPSTIEVALQLDVWTTYGHRVQFGECVIERGHIGIANERNFWSGGRQYLTVPEGLDTGTQYRVINGRHIDLFDEKHAMVQLISTISLEANHGDKENPHISPATGGAIDGIGVPVNVYYIKFSDLPAFMRTFRDVPWATQGIVSATLMPRGRVTTTTLIGAPNINVPNIPHHNNVAWLEREGIKYFSAYTTAVETSTFRNRIIKGHIGGNWRDSSAVLGKIPKRYRHLKKFFTSPYMMVEVSNGAGQSLLLKPEEWQNGDGNFGLMYSHMPSSQRITFLPLGYGTETWNSHNDIDHIQFGESLNMTCNISGFPQLPVLNDQAQIGLANNARTLAYGYQAAEWTRDKAKYSGYAMGNISSAQNMTNIENTRLANEAMRSATVNNINSAHDVMWNNLPYDAVRNIVGGTVHGAAAGGSMGMTGGPIGVGAGAAIGGAVGLIGGVGSTALDHMQNTSNHAIQSGYTAATMHSNWAAHEQTTANNASLNTNVMNINRDLMLKHADIDYQAAVEGLNAKKADMEMTPPSTAGAFGGEFMNMMHGLFGFTIRWKFISERAMVQLGEYWLRYGYAVNRPHQPTQLLCMQNFAYWKMAMCHIRATMPETLKGVVTSIFEQGTTVWRDPDKIGLTDWGDNKPVGGIRL